MNFKAKLSERIAMEDVKEILRLIDNSDNSKQELYDLVVGEDENIGYHAAWVLTHFSAKLINGCIKNKMSLLTK